jgi:glycosyltransferase involved in cell wall biosynthesis
MHYLICDLNIKKRGHYIAYNQYILDTIDKMEGIYPTNTYSFLFNGEARDYLNFPQNTKGRVHFLHENCKNNISLLDKITLFKRVIAAANEIKTDHLIFMDLDQYQFPIFVSKFSFKLSGILFRPHHRISPSANTFSSRLSSMKQRLKKIIAEKLLTFKKNIEHIFILNDEEGVNYLNRFHKTSQFKYLPDPIFSYPSDLEIYKESTSFKFLIFGTMSERKNITNILKAYSATTFSIQTELLVVGSVDDVYLNQLNSLIKNLTLLNPSNTITIKTGFVSDEEMDNYFHTIDVCLLIYKDFYGSSGLLGRAALHKKKVIGANVGLLKELVEQNKLGITCDPKSIQEISKALLNIINVQFDEENFELFYRSYSPDAFLKTLLN